MSQAKVDKYKEEKKNRTKILKRKKAKKIVGILVIDLIIACAIGYPLGKKLYKVSVEHRKANATFETNLYQYWAQEYWNSTYSSYWGTDDETTTTDTDATATDATAEDAEQ